MLKIGKAPPATMLAELKAFLRIEDDREDAVLAGLLRAATEAVEAMLGSLLLERDVEELASVAGGAVRLTAGPFRSLVSVTLAGDDAGLLAAEDIEAVLKPGGGAELRLRGGSDGARVTVRYRAGLASDWNGLPEVLRLAVMRAAAHFQLHRDASDEPGMPAAIRGMLAPWRARRI